MANLLGLPCRGVRRVLLSHFKVCIKLRYSSSFFLVFNYFVFILASSPFILIPFIRPSLYFFGLAIYILIPHSPLFPFVSCYSQKNVYLRIFEMKVVIIIKTNGFYQFLKRIKLIQKECLIYKS